MPTLWPARSQAVSLAGAVFSYVPLLCVTIVVAPFVMSAPFLPERYWLRCEVIIRELRGWAREIPGGSVQEGT